MYPLTFDEFLQALGEQGLSATVNTADAKHPIDQPIHRKLVDEVKTYQLIGGMPAVVKAYADKRDISACFKILDDLVLTLQDDFAKYKKRAPVSRLAEVLRSVVVQSGGKFKYSDVPSASYAHAISEALRLLVQAGLTYRVTHTAARGIPLGAQSDETKFKVLIFDVGIHQRLLGLDIPEYLTAGDIELVNKGSLAEVFTGLEIIGNYPSHVRPALYYWHRETRGSNAEVDYVIQRGKQIIPIEVKAGVKGKMQSMRLFMQERGLTHGVRISLENFSDYAGIDVIPLYAVRRLASNRLDVAVR
jgi:predicted AAA+ superfamily ATPase